MSFLNGLRRCMMGLAVVAAVGSWSTMASAKETIVQEKPDLDSSLVYGARIFVEEGTKYYASADGFGSGDYGTIGNRYTPIGTDLYVGGFSHLDENGRLQEYQSYNPNNVPIAEDWSNRSSDVAWNMVWVSFFLDPNDTRPMGWLPSSSIVVVNGIFGDGKTNAIYKDGFKLQDDTGDSIYNIVDAEDLEAEVIDAVLPDPGNMIEDRVIHGQDAGDEDEETAFITTREIAYAIEDYADNGENVALLLDASGSVVSYMSDISDYGSYIDKVNKADIIVAFGWDFMVIKAEDYLDAPVKRGGTDIYSPLNNLDVSSYDRIIIVTDTYHNTKTHLLSCDEFDGKIVIVSPVDLSETSKEVIQKIEEAFGSVVYLCLLDNELDRIKALEALQ